MAEGRNELAPQGQADEALSPQGYKLPNIRDAARALIERRDFWSQIIWKPAEYDTLCELLGVTPMPLVVTVRAAPADAVVAATRMRKALQEVKARTYSSDRNCTLKPSSVAAIYDLASQALSETTEAGPAREERP